MTTIVRITHSAKETINLGRSLGKVLQKGDLVALVGNLGSGKTTLIQGICEGLGVKEKVTSPTFVLITSYEGRVPVHHFDLYRLDKREDFLNLGYEEFFFGEGVTLIEWAERIMELLPSRRVEVHLARLKDHVREIEIIPFGEWGLRDIEAVGSSNGSHC